MSNHLNLTHPKYRADIDGLRAIAILAVVGFHAFPSWIKGGFIGVDIFFVISGFLISTIIIGSLERNSFSFVEFFIRRIRRIFPALLLVLMACFAFGWFALFPDEYKQLGKHLAGGAGFVSNFVFLDESGYFDNAAETKPLLHLWSLGIEEQFYIVWPLLLWLAWKKRFNLLTITISVAVISFTLNILRVRTDGVAAFYLPQTRFWELLSGSVLSYVLQHRQYVWPRFKHVLETKLSKITHAQFQHANGKTLCNVQSVLGATLIAIGVLVITKEMHFPGWWAALPVLGTVLIISAGMQAWFNRVVLSNRVLVWFGLISFPLYLWHWPLLSFARIIGSETPSLEIRIAAVLISIVLAWGTYKLIESPLRFGGYGKEKTVSLLVLMAVVGYVGYNSFDRGGLNFRIKTAELHKRPGQFDCGDQLNKEADKPAPCILGNKVSKKTILIYGDSHAGQLTNALNEAVGEKYKILFFFDASCFLGEEISFPLIENPATCNAIKESIKGLRNENIYAVIRSQRWHGYGITQKIDIEHAIDDAITAFDLHPDRLIIAGSTADVDIDCEIANYYSSLSWRKKRCKSFDESKIINNTFISTTKNMHLAERVHFVYPYERICPNDICVVIDGQSLNYVDMHHLSKDGALLVMQDIIDALEK